MKVHELKVTAKQDRKRVGRGIGSGTGKTAGRGTKGQNSRTGGGVRPGFEGGQNPLYRRLPKKRGFKPHGKVDVAEINLDQLERVGKATIDIESLIKAGVVNAAAQNVKLLGNGEVKKAYTVKLFSISASAKTKIEQAGGKVELLK